MINMFQKNTLSCIEDLKNLGSLIALIAKAAPDTTLANDVELCAGMAWDITNKVSHTLALFMHKQNISDCPNEIRTQREACGLTTGELAELLDLDEDIIIQWENGKAEPLASQVIPLSNILDCDPMWLLTGFHSDTTKES
ncbi:helix-turn-helix domain-containing protein [Escherichia coli]|nr:helix-turn-helix domain-containing protein [Escherichia coli]EHP9864085.1 helix-turn-helix domain-containing protein [Escherichia coli]EHP9886734.1 helix-turn-helix domain-containing protein [Escherichia coli]EHQ0035470.1 helix-turn-helix domain-containing protein [Escherichia coli]EHQ0050974.1 helix-turn-helix domain-containing protein [Escherichia coli]